MLSKDELIATLKDCGWTKAFVAERLGVDEKSVRRYTRLNLAPLETALAYQSQKLDSLAREAGHGELHSFVSEAVPLERKPHKLQVV